MSGLARRILTNLTNQLAPSSHNSLLYTQTRAVPGLRAREQRREGGREEERRRRRKTGERNRKMGRGREGVEEGQFNIYGLW